MSKKRGRKMARESRADHLTICTPQDLLQTLRAAERRPEKKTFFKTVQEVFIDWRKSMVRKHEQREPIEMAEMPTQKVKFVPPEEY